MIQMINIKKITLKRIEYFKRMKYTLQKNEIYITKERNIYYKSIKNKMELKGFYETFMNMFCTDDTYVFINGTRSCEKRRYWWY